MKYNGNMSVATWKLLEINDLGKQKFTEGTIGCCDYTFTIDVIELVAQMHIDKKKVGHPIHIRNAEYEDSWTVKQYNFGSLMKLGELIEKIEIPLDEYNEQSFDHYKAHKTAKTFEYFARPLVAELLEEVSDRQADSNESMTT